MRRWLAAAALAASLAASLLTWSLLRASRSARDAEGRYATVDRVTACLSGKDPAACVSRPPERREEAPAGAHAEGPPPR
jgi:hypothetical protein